ncbi:MAG TPA: hypothetical protein VGY53_00320 [Isosphaeraceae bacterium]|nr:hypothetical protein [Isosphaeraceae bacterium]
MEQVIFTSLSERGRAGYHVVSRSPGVSEAEATTVATWAPSQGSLLLDASNRVSVNFHPLPTGRLALARTCQGPAEYSGRGERQVYTHALIFDPSALRETGNQPISVYRDALALGYLQFQIAPHASLKPVELGNAYSSLDRAACAARAEAMGLGAVRELIDKLAAGQSARICCGGDRTALAECLLGLLPRERVLETSFSTSLQPSAVRPHRLILLPEPSASATTPPARAARLR